MRNYAVFVVGITAVLLTGFLPAEDGCALAAATNHTCCAKPQVETTSSCCSDDEASNPRTDVGHEVGCKCVHTPATPVTMVPAGPSVGADDGQTTVVPFHGSITDSTTVTRTRSIERRVRSHPPPPVFLLDCSFLI